MIYRSQFAVAERGQTESAMKFLESLRDRLKGAFPDYELKGLEPLLVNQFTRRLKLHKGCDSLILEPPSDSVPTLNTAQKYENLKLVEEKDSLFASIVSTRDTSVSDQALVASRPHVTQVQS